MNWHISFMGILCFVAFQGMFSYADHELPAGTVERLERDTRDLNYAVSYSTLRYAVKQAVARFAYDVDRFVDCVHGGPHITDDHDLIPGNCEFDLHHVRRSWYPVERYLYDTYYDYPQVYRRYLRVRDDLRMFPFGR